VKRTSSDHVKNYELCLAGRSVQFSPCNENRP